MLKNQKRGLFTIKNKLVKSYENTFNSTNLRNIIYRWYWEQESSAEEGGTE